VGGRIRTIHDPLAPVPLELGAEFVHGRPRETWDIISHAGLTVYERRSEALHLVHGRTAGKEHAGENAEKLLSHVSRHKDESLADFLRRSDQKPDVKKWALAHLEGFNAARKERISTASLKQDSVAAEEIDGDHIFSILNGYDSIVYSLLRDIPDHAAVIKRNAVVHRIEWRRGRVTVRFVSSLDQQESVLHCARLIVTIPLGVLQQAPRTAGSIEFVPAPNRILDAARKLEFGQVYRVTFQFENRFWEDDKRLSQASFMLSREKLFPTWWTTYPVLAPVLTGWSAGPAGEALRDSARPEVIGAALRSLSRVLKREIPTPAAVHFHDWHGDPFFRGAYSYTPVKTRDARRTLASPVDDTLFFAGEATRQADTRVHGALASGQRAARQILSSAQASERRRA
jgi:monoamine oxidase